MRILDTQLVINAILRLSSAFAMAVLFLSSPLHAKTEASNCCEKVDKMLYLIQKLHFHPPEFDKNFASDAINNYLFYIDGQCLHLYESDFIALKEIQRRETSARTIFCKTFEYLEGIYPNRLIETDSILKSCKTKKMAWQKDEALTFYESFEANYPKTRQQKTKRIDDYVKLYTLRQLEFANRLDLEYEFEKNESLKNKAIVKFKNSVDKKTKASNGITNYLEENLLQAIIFTCDPHSDYFTPSKKNRFTQMLSTTVEVFGFTCDENQNEDIEIVAISPGSPAWASNNLNLGDRVTQIKFKNKPQVDVSDYTLEEFNNLFAMNDKEMDIVVVKKNGAVIKTHLIKALLKSEDNTVNGYILAKDFPIGYISLPSFYTDFSKLSSDGCANDVAKEIVKLKEDNIQGLILDLRNNGGGSVDEAANLAGIFIDAAPLFIEQIQSLKPQVIKDLNRGVIYSGPLVVLVNKGSASASELLAQILKMQHRAIIVGNTTYGKATGQVIVPLDTAYSLFNPSRKYNETEGYIKITIEKFYDISGATHQKNGVIPHIELPDLWSGIAKGENAYPNALSNDQIAKKVKTDALPDAKVNTCSALSKDRVAADHEFKRTRTLSDTLRNLYVSNTIPLYPPQYRAVIQTTNTVDSIVDTAFSGGNQLFTVTPNRNNIEIMKADEFLRTLISDEINDLRKDIILREAYQILMDYNSN